jgi:hypothetical protein
MRLAYTVRKELLQKGHGNFALISIYVPKSLLELCLCNVFFLSGHQSWTRNWGATRAATVAPLATPTFINGI